MMTPMQRVDILRAACCIAGIDGMPNDAERAVIVKLAREMGVGRASMEAMIERGVTDPKFHEEQFRVLNSEPQETMAVLLEVAMADGSLSDQETEVLRALSEKLAIPTAVFDELILGVKKLMSS